MKFHVLKCAHAGNLCTILALYSKAVCIVDCESCIDAFKFGSGYRIDWKSAVVLGSAARNATISDCRSRIRQEKARTAYRKISLRNKRISQAHTSAMLMLQHSSSPPAFCAPGPAIVRLDSKKLCKVQENDMCPKLFPVLAQNRVYERNRIYTMYIQ